MFAVELNLDSCSQIRPNYLVYQPKGAVPARDLKDVSDCVGQVIEPALEGCRRISIPVPHRPVNHKRLPDNIFPRHKPPIAAVLTVVAVVAEYKVVSLGNN